MVPKTQTSDAALREYLRSLALPPGLVAVARRGARTCESRLWLLENSSRMRVPDGHAGGRDRDASAVTRWEELRGVVAHHCGVAARCRLPTRYWLLDDPARSAGRPAGCEAPPQRFGVGASSKGAAAEVASIDDILERVTLDQPQCPLAACLRSLAKGLVKEGEAIAARGEHVTLVICTQGRPIDRHGESGAELFQEFQDELSSLAKLPVKIVVRLCTDNEEVRDVYNALDQKIDALDVLDDFWTESREVYLHNPWLTYTMGLHRLRESGLAPAAMGDIDQEPLCLDKIHDICKTLFLGDDDRLELPHPKEGWNGFFQALTALVEREEPQWNPIKKKLTPWISLAKLHAMHSGGTSSHYHFHSSYKRRDTSAARFPRTSPRRPFSPRQPPQTSPKHVAPSNDSKDAGLTLPEALVRWSHQPPDFDLFYPLAHLLVTVPRTFPPANPRVEPHAYFKKWKMFDEEAFVDEEGHELKELLRRAVRKAKFFLHPDKLPKDLTENQTLLFRTLWDIIQNREATTLR